MAVVVFLLILDAVLRRAVGTDAMNQQYWLSDYSHLVLSGTLLPRWIPTGFHNLGAPSFYFYPPLAFWLAAPVRAITGIHSGSGLFQTLSLLSVAASFFTARMFLKRIAVSKYRANVGAALYAIAPYKIAEWYARSSISSTIAFVFIPLFALGLLYLIDNRNPWRGAVLLAVSLALITLASVPIALVVIVCGTIAAALFWKRITLRVVWSTTVASVLFVALTAFQLSSILAWENFVQLNQLKNNPEYAISKFLAMDLNATTYYYTALYVVFGIIALVAFRTWMRGAALTSAERNVLRTLLVILGLALLLEVPAISRPIWLGAPILHLIQGVYRFYIVLVLLVSCFVAVASSRPIRSAASAILTVWGVAAMVPLAVVLFQLHFNPHVDPDAVDPPEYATIYAPANRYVLEAMVLRHEGDAPALLDSEGTAGDRIQPDDSIAHDRFTVSLSEKRLVTFHRLYWPGFHLCARGQEIASQPDSIGRATAIFPAGKYTATWELIRSPLETAGLWISGPAWIGVLIFWGIGLVRTRVKKNHLAITIA